MIRLSIIRRFLHYLGFHNWKFIRSTGVNKYFECKICGKRDVVFPFNGCYQPIDRDWLNRQQNSFNRIPPSF